MKSKNKNITFSALMSALATAVMLLSFFPYLTYAVPAVAGLFIMIVVIEIDLKWAIMSYIVSCAPIFLLAENESKLLYIMFLGYYPIIKALIEKVRKPVLEWAIKIFAFNCAVLLVYFVFAEMLGVSLDDLGEFSKWGVYILLAAGNVVFVLYDIAVSRMAMFYLNIVKPKFKKV